MKKNGLIGLVLAAAVMGGCAESDISGDVRENGEGTAVSAIAEDEVMSLAESMASDMAESESVGQTVEESEVTKAGDGGEDKAEEETVVIAGKEISVNDEYVRIDIGDNDEAVTDISELGKLKKLERLEINCGGWGNWPDKRFDGFEALSGCETLDSVSLDAWPADEDDWYVLETLPNLRYLELYSYFYEGFDLELPALETFVLTTTDYSDNVTDISPIKGFKNLKRLCIDRVSDGGGHYTIDGLDVLTGNETIEDIMLRVYPENDEDWHVLETMPGLTGLGLYGDVPDNFEFNIPSLKYLSILGSPNFSKLENLANLEILSLDGIGDYTGESDGREEFLCVARIPNLIQLELDRCSFTDYSGLLESESIEYLTIKNSEPMTVDMYNRFCEKFDNCEIDVKLIE